MRTEMGNEYHGMLTLPTLCDLCTKEEPARVTHASHLAIRREA